jgi:hypothetical protein
MKLVRPLILLALVVALLGAVAGCGGGSSSSSAETDLTEATEPSSTEPPAEGESEEAEPEVRGEVAEESEAEGEAASGPRAAVIKEGDEICLATDEVTAKLQAEFKKANEPGAADFETKLAELLVRIVVIGRTEGEELSSINPPAKDQKILGRWITTGQEGLSQFESAARILKSEGQSPKFAKVYEEGQKTLTKANEIAAGYGFKVCGGARAF